MNQAFNSNLNRAAMAILVTGLSTCAMAGQVPGQNGLLSFWYQASGANVSALAVADPNGSLFEVILDPASTQAIEFVGHISWSPDGKRIIFNAQVEGGGSWHLFVIDTNGSNLQELAWDDEGTAKPLVDCRNFEWAENGLVYADCRVDPNGAITFDPDSGEILHFCAGVRNRNPALSPDGQTLVFWRQSDIRTAPVSDPCDSTVLAADLDDINPAHTIWSPDGSTIFFTDRVGGQTPPSNANVMSIPATGGTPTLILAGAFSPQPSPDGTQLAYADWDGPLYIATIDGKNPINLFAQWGIDETGSFAGALSWHSEQPIFHDRFEDSSVQ